jgi:glycosyltransferase involved in cell wall biosynthesis
MTMSANAPNEKIISIVTPSLNQSEFLGETIGSVLSQEGNFYIDYIIRDGGSSDDSVLTIESYQNLLKQNCDVIGRSGLDFYVSSDRRFEWNRCLGISYRWVSEKDEGQPDAINSGMRLMQGSVAAFINSDDVYYPQTFSRVLELDWNKTDFAYGQGMWISREGRELLPYPTFKPTKYSLYYQCTLCQPAAFFRREAFERLGLFSLDYRCAFDYEYWLRAIFQGCRFTYLKKPLAASRMHAANKSMRDRPKVVEEVRALRRQYYGDNAAQLGRLGLLLGYAMVEIPTHLRIKRLRRILQRQTR